MRNKQMDADTKETQLEQAKAISAKAAEEAAIAEAKLTELEQDANAILASLPNILDDLVPDGNDDKDNQHVEAWGDLQALPTLLGWNKDGNFHPKWHDDVATNLGGWHSDKAVAISGARFVALSGHVARLERAISSFFLDLHTIQHGYTEVSVPFVVSRTALEGTTQLPKFELDLFKIDPKSHKCNGQDAFLIPTAEVPLTNLHRESILDEADLPLSYVALTPCFRAEAGSYGRDTRGLIRTHQFHKVELVKITSAESSDEEHDKLTKHAQKCLELLKLPYRKVRLCSGDIGFSARHCYDLEVWLPGSGEYREISSCSNTGDFQARRMGLRYRPLDKLSNTDEALKKKNTKAKPQFCHTINGSGLAVGRTLVAILENYQLPDGSLMVPEVLVPYMGGQTVLRAVSIIENKVK
jgi:seryl-tRNA synthetase